MYIRFKRSLRGDYGRAYPGDVKLVSPEVAKSLIQRDLAEETVAPADDNGEQLQAQITALIGKSAEEIEAAHSGPELHALAGHLGLTVPKNMGKPKLAAALFDAIAALPNPDDQ